MLEYLVIDHRNNTITKKVAKSHRYFCWMYWHVYAPSAKSSASCFDLERNSYVIDLYK